MKWLSISNDKLTDYDTQILTLVGLDTNAWSAGPTTLSHPKYGDFFESLSGFGLQCGSHRSTPAYRQLSWRGQIRLRQKHAEILRSSVDDAALKAEAAAPQPSTTQVKKSVSGGFGGVPGSTTAVEMATRQAAWAQGLQAQFDQSLQSIQQAATATYQRQLLEQQQQARLLPGEALIPKDMIHGKTIDEIRAMGFSDMEITKIIRYACGDQTHGGGAMYQALVDAIASEELSR